MEERLNYVKAAPNGYRAMAALNRYVEDIDLEPLLLELVRMRASQINGCAYCLDMHSKDARALGESEQRLYALNAWRETTFFTPRERAGLAWIEAVTLVSETHVPDEVYEDARTHFSEKEIFDLTFIASTINAWNRIAIASRTAAGTYRRAGVKV